MKILVYTSPARGHLFPILPTLQELLARGHEIAVRTLASQVELVESLGMSAAPIDPAIESIEHDDYLGKTPVAKLKRGMATFVERAPFEIDDLDAAIALEQPDALLVDCMCWGGAIVAERTGVPWAQWFPYPMPLNSRDVPPFGPGLPPARGAAGRQRDRLLRLLLTRQLASAILPGLNEIRSGAGVPSFKSPDELFTSPPLTLYMTAEPLEYPRSDWPDSVRQVGPCPWDPPAETPEWLEAIDKQLVLVTTSSEFQDDGKLVSVALEALADEEDLFVIATLPSNAPPQDVPGNARVETFIPHAPILERAVCAVTHGGAGGTQKALAAGVPVCVVPFGRDQLEVARRVETADAGTRLTPGRLSPERLRSAIREAIDKKAGAERVAEGFTRAGGGAKAADLFEAQVQNAGSLVA